MHFRKSIHRILITIGIALGIIATGTTVNAKAQQFNSNNSEENNTTAQQGINNSIQPSRSHLINQSNNSSITRPSVSTLYKDNNEYFALNNPQLNGSEEFNNRQNYSNNKYQSNSQNDSRPQFNHQLNHIYHNILHHQVYSVDGISNSIQHRHFHHFNSDYIHHHFEHHHLHHWFRDGLSHRNLRARNWISWHESSHRWHALSYGGVCVGYFQLNPNYLGYRHGHVDLRRHHQVRVADHYVRYRYGNWVNAKRFWVAHHWY